MRRFIPPAAALVLLGSAVSAAAQSNGAVQNITSFWQFRVFESGCKVLTIPRFRSGWLRVHNELKPPLKYVLAVRSSPAQFCGTRDDDEEVLAMQEFKVVDERTLSFQVYGQPCTIEIDEAMTKAYFVDARPASAGKDHCYQDW